MNQKRIIIAIIIIMIVALVGTSIALVIIKEKDDNEIIIIPKSEAIDIVPTMNSKLTTDASWVGTFELLWDDLKNNLIHKDIEFLQDPDNIMTKDLNNSLFNQRMINESKYYKTYGLATPSLKQTIEENIKSKFNQESDILDDFQFEEESDTYLFYAMLYNLFEYKHEFVDLGEGLFNDETAKYFGTTDASLYNDSIKVLYYDDDNSFAISLKTKADDEVILIKKPDGLTFNDIYNNMNIKTTNYNGETTFNKKDFFRMPYISLNVTREYNELENKIFNDIDGTGYVISKALQTLKLKIDNKGGEIKSEAAIGVKETALEENPGRNFSLNSNFVIFIKEENKELPYLALRVDNITKFQ